MTISIRKLGLALCLATCFSFSSKAQTVDNTGNLINDNNWSGVVYGYDPHDCCSNPGGSQPLYNIPDGIIKWSYGQATVSQSIAIQSALSAAGTGLQVHGYNWSWWVRNDNGGTHQSGVDRLNYWVNTTNSSGQLIDQMSGTYDTYFGPTQFSGTRTFSSPYNLSDLGGLTVSFSGRDNGFWAGLYGPEVGNVNISLNYSVNPCASDPLYSPSCQGYTQALLSLTPAIEDTISIPSVDVVEAVVVVEESPTVAQQATVESSGSTNQQESTRSQGSGISLSRVLNILSREQARIGNLERSTVEVSVEQSINQANQTLDQINATVSAITMQSQNTATQINENQQSEQSKNDAVSVSGFSAVDLLNTETTKTEETKEDTQKPSTVNRNTQSNELEGSVTLASLATQPLGFEAYSTGMKDGSFYAPKEIYQNQKVTDNPSGRRLFGGTDRLHNEMVQQQYRTRE